ncbi:hypothetical protein [Photobacterium sp. TY1-4]|uniref:hypothetical protein n=1 Tax=Photobacterium sp. TY1-4 TaxID=2899122 RepID=UPI0021C1B4CF|nr:hypothetical protein [Photobacterium sp. TY1-4]UXI03519.1 hypothetical protein NH461_24170 [Photobacterium sp. TY1-4]
MKTKFLTACLAAALLAGCNNSNEARTGSTYKVQAFDGAIQNIAGSFTCTNDGETETGTLPKTAWSGFSTVSATAAALIITNPETCKFTFAPTVGAVDVSNGKAMDEVSLSIPRGLATTSSPVVATPLTTLITQELGDADYNESTATTVLTNLGLGDVLNAGGLTVAQLVTDLEGSIKTLESSADQNTKKLGGQLTATTHVLTDVIVQKGTLTTTQTAVLAKNLTTTVTATNPFYPAGGADGKGAAVVVDVKATVEAVKEKPEDLATMTDPKTTIDDIPPVVKENVDKGTDIAKPVPNPEPEVPTGTTGSAGSAGGSGA